MTEEAEAVYAELCNLFFPSNNDSFNRAAVPPALNIGSFKKKRKKKRIEK